MENATSTPEFPEISFWNIGAQQLELVNGEDFHWQKIMDGLGVPANLSDLCKATTDGKEIVRRQEILDLLMKDKKIREFFLAWRSEIAEIPTEDGQVFLDYFNVDGKNVFWDKVNKLQNLAKSYLKKGTIKLGFAELLGFIEGKRDDIREREQQYVKDVAEVIDKALVLQGMVEYQTTNGDPRVWNASEEVYGYKKYSFWETRQWSFIELPKWITSNPVGKDKYRNWRNSATVWIKYLAASVWYTIWAPVRWYTDWSNASQEFKRFSPSVITSMPVFIKESLRFFLETELLLQLMQPAFTGKHYDDNVRLKLFFSYNEKGLKVRLLNIHPVFPGDRQTGLNSVIIENPVEDRVPFFKEHFPGYTRKKVKEIVEANSVLINEMNGGLYNTRYLLGMYEFIEKKHPQLLIGGLQIKCPGAKEAQMETLYGIINSPDFKKDTDAVMGFREYVNTKFLELNMLANLADSLVKKLASTTVPYSFPNILDDSKHLVSFDSLYPIHLVGQEDSDGKEIRIQDLIAIENMAPLNGRILGLTGQNKGGKTVTQEAVTNAIYMAQCGLPVPGSGVQLNPKNKLALVFIERGQGSTLELLFKKIKNVLEAVDTSEKNGIVVIIDELGTGTQEEAGYDIGKKVLEKLKQRGTSTLFSTQITQLAKCAETDMNALCFNFDLNHRVRPGIGAGNADLLAKKMGLKKYLN